MRKAKSYKDECFGLFLQESFLSLVTKPTFIVQFLRFVTPHFFFPLMMAISNFMASVLFLSTMKWTKFAFMWRKKKTIRITLQRLKTRVIQFLEMTRSDWPKIDHTYKTWRSYQWYFLLSLNKLGKIMDISKYLETSMGKIKSHFLIYKLEPLISGLFSISKLNKPPRAF